MRLKKETWVFCKGEVDEIEDIEDAYKYFQIGTFKLIGEGRVEILKNFTIEIKVTLA